MTWVVETQLVRHWWMAKPSPPGFFFFFFFFSFSYLFIYLFIIIIFFLIFTVAIGVEQLSPLLIFFFLVAIGVEQLSPLLINHKTRWFTIRWKRAKEESVLKSWNWEKRGSEWPIENFEGIIVISSWCRYLLYWVVSTSKKLTWREWLIRYFLPKQRVGMT